MRPEEKKAPVLQRQLSHLRDQDRVRENTAWQ